MEPGYIQKPIDPLAHQRPISDMREVPATTIRKRELEIFISTLIDRSLAQGNPDLILETIDQIPNTSDRIRSIQILFAKGVWTNSSSQIFDLFQSACKNKNLPLAESLASYIDPKVRDLQGRTPLHLAAYWGVQGAVAQLISKEVDLNATDDFGRTALYFASMSGQEAVVETLLQAGADPSIGDDQNSVTPLHEASFYGHLGVVKKLIEAKPLIVDVVDKYGRTPLDYAFRSRNRSVINYLEEANLGAEYKRGLLEGDIDKPDSEGRTRLLIAIDRGDNQIAMNLIENGANPNVRNNQGETALHFASGTMIPYLIDKGIDINVTDNFGQTPLHKAAMTYSFGDAKALIKLKPDLEAKDHRQKTALHHASSTGDDRIVEQLILAGADLQCVDRNGEMPIHLAISNGHLPVLKMIAKETGTSLTDAKGNTLLHYAVEKVQLEIIEWLCHNTDFINTKNKAGQTPLDVAYEKSAFAIAILERFGAKTARQLKDESRLRKYYQNLDLQKNRDTPDII